MSEGTLSPTIAVAVGSSPRRSSAIRNSGGSGLPTTIGLTPAASQAPTYDAAKKAGATLGYGTFITVSVNFIIIAFVLFLLIRGMNRVIKEEERAAPPPAPPTKDQELLTEIRDLLKARA